jgi:PLP dependent protein
MRESEIASRLAKIKATLPASVSLIAVSKTHPAEFILEAYQAGHRDFGENRVQELVPKFEQLPKDIRWHLIGHLQSNKVKYIAPFVHLIHSVDSFSLLKEINKQAAKNNRVINVLLQIYIANEETKFGLSFEEAEQLLASSEFSEMKNIAVLGLMGMATNTEDMAQVRNEFQSLLAFFTKIQNSEFKIPNSEFNIVSMGMSSDYSIAIESGSTMIRVGSTIFGSR